MNYEKFKAYMRIFVQIGRYMKRENVGIKNISEPIQIVSDIFHIKVLDSMYPISYEENGKKNYILLGFIDPEEKDTDIKEFITNVLDWEDATTTVILCPTNDTIDSMSNEELLEALNDICTPIVNSTWRGAIPVVKDDIIIISYIFAAMFTAFKPTENLMNVVDEWRQENYYGSYVIGAENGSECLNNIDDFMDSVKSMQSITKYDFDHYNFMPGIKLTGDEK